MTLTPAGADAEFLAKYEAEDKDYGVSNADLAQLIKKRAAKGRSLTADRGRSLTAGSDTSATYSEAIDADFGLSDEKIQAEFHRRASLPGGVKALALDLDISEEQLQAVMQRMERKESALSSFSQDDLDELTVRDTVPVPLEELATTNVAEAPEPAASLTSTDSTSKVRSRLASAGLVSENPVEDQAAAAKATGKAKAKGKSRNNKKRNSSSASAGAV